MAIALLNENEKKKVVEAIKLRSAHAPDRRKRSEARHDASRLPDITIEVRGPSGDVQTHTVPPVDLSPGGMAFLHCSFLYPGSAISATLRTRDGEQMSVTGKVMRCEHVSGRVHEVGVKLDHPIDPTALGAKAEETAAKPAGPVPWEDIRRLAEKLAQLAGEAKDAASAGKLLSALARYEGSFPQR
ncbi:MAG TPA: PilZ domain-containing protein [Phycisphaerales bacterium]